MNASTIQILIAFALGCAAGPFFLAMFNRAIFKHMMRTRGRAYMQAQAREAMDEELDQLKSELDSK